MKKYNHILILLILTFALLCSVGVAAEVPSSVQIISFDTENYTEDEIRAVAEEYGLTPILLGYYSADSKTAAALSDHPMVLGVEESSVGRLAAETAPFYNDAYFDLQWNLKNISVETCWKYYTTGSSDVRVCVIDSGFDMDHPDAQKNFIAGKDYTAEEDSVVTADSTSHGTSCAGIIGATSDNAIGIAGLLKDVTVINQCTFYWDEEAKEKKTTVDLVARAIMDAVDVYDADIISMSLLFEENSDVLKAACDYAAEKGVILVAAAGNNGSEGSALQYPAAYDSVIGVGAVDYKNSVASYSAKNESVFCCAPGVNIYTLQNPDNPESEDLGFYRNDAGGTSVAAPHVAGLAALALSYDPGLTASEWKELLEKSCTDLGKKGYDTSYGYGLINCEKMMKLIDGNVFDDVAKKDWFHDAVLDVYKRELMIGLKDTEFGPSASLTRGMFVTILYRLEGSPEVTNENPFTDLPEDPYYYNIPISWAYQNNITKGKSETQFAPEDMISRQEVVTMLDRYFSEYKKQPLPEKYPAIDFRDAKDVADWAEASVNAMAKAGVVNGYLLEDENGDYSVFRPQNTISRSEAAMVFSNLYKNGLIKEDASQN